MPSSVDASPRLPSFMSATKASSSRATNTANDPTGIFPALRSPRTTNNTTSSNAASNNTASNVPDLPSGTVTTVTTTAAAAQDSQSDAQDVEDEPEKPSKSASTTKVTASQRARQYLRWAKAHPYPATDEDGNITTADDDEDRKTVYALIRQIDPSGDKLQSLASLCEEEAGEKKWPASWDQGKLGYLKGMIKKDLVRWVRQLVPVEEEDEDDVEVAANASLPATVGTGSAQGEEAVVAEELAKRVDGLSVGAEVGVQGGLGLQLESQPVGAAQVTGGEGGALLGPVGVQAAPPLAFASVPSPAARPQANPQQILQNTFLGVGIQTAPPPATVIPSPAPGPPANSQQSIAHNWFSAGAEVAPALAPAPVNVQPSPAPAPRPVTQQPVQYDPAWWQWYRQRHAARRRAETEEEEEAGFF